MSYLFHVTYYKNLSGISHEGLIPNRGSSIGAPAYDFHRKNHIFFSEPHADVKGPAIDDYNYTSVSYWFDKAEEFAYHYADNCFTSGYVPVVLRIDRDLLQEELEEDTLGAQDSGHPAFKTRESISPEYLDVWTGKRWVPIEDWDSIDISSSFNSEDDPDAEPLVDPESEDFDPDDYYSDSDYDEDIHGDYHEYKINKNKLFYFKENNPLLPKASQLHT